MIILTFSLSCQTFVNFIMWHILNFFIFEFLKVYMNFTITTYVLFYEYTCLLGPIRVHIPNGILIGSAVSAQLTADLLYFTMGRHLCPPLKCPLA